MSDNNRMARKGLFFMIIASFIKDSTDLWLVGLMFFVGGGNYFFSEWNYLKESKNER